VFILKLDKIVRDFDMPETPTAEDLMANPNLSLALQNFTLHGYREMSEDRSDQLLSGIS
jgi:hypothetical protein